MAKIPNGLLKQWKDGDMVHADDYQRERDTMTTAINDIDDKVTTLTQTSGTTTATLNSLGTAVNNKTDLTGDHQGTWQGNSPSGLIANKADKTTVGALSSLATSDKSSIVNAINEVRSTSGVAPDWSVVQNKPATFPPSAHTHPISDITNLQTLLDGKVDETVPTVSGDLNTYVTTGFYTISASTTNAPDTNSYNLIVASNGTNVTQTALRLNSNFVGVWTRSSINNGSTWSTWVRGITTGDLTSTPSNSTTTALVPNTLYTFGIGSDSNWTITSNGSAVDFNTTYTNSVMRYLTGTLTNQPSGVTTNVYFYQMRYGANDFLQQIITNESTPRYFIRAKTANVWGGWRQINDWNSLSSKPTTISGYGITDGATTTQVGTLSSLTTTAKGDLVSAINEVNAKPSGGGTWGSITGTLSNQTDLNNALNAKAPLASPALTGTPTAPTVATSDNSTSIATTAWVKAQGYGGAGSAAWGSITGTLANQTDLNTALGNKLDSSQKNAVNGIAPLDASSKVPAANLPDGTLSAKGVVQLAQIPSSSTSVALSPAALFNLGFSDGNYTPYNTTTAVDLNTTLDASCFRYLTGTLTNQPSGVTTNVYVNHINLGSTNYFQQIWTNEANPRYFYRAKTAGTWGSWKQNDDWNNLTNKPSTFTPSAHTHVVADITDLSTNYYNKTEVDAKVSAYNSFADLNRWIN